MASAAYQNSSASNGITQSAPARQARWAKRDVLRSWWYRTSESVPTCTRGSAAASLATPPECHGIRGEVVDDDDARNALPEQCRTVADHVGLVLGYADYLGVDPATVGSWAGQE